MRVRWSGHVTHMGEVKNAYKILVGMPEGRRPFRGYGHKWEDINMDLREVWSEVVDWIHLPQDGNADGLL